MPTRYCLFCWAENAWDASRCARCDAPLMGPEANDIPYVEKLLLALHHPEPEARARAATLLGRVGEPDDQRISAALIKALHHTNDMREIASGTEAGTGQRRQYDASAQVEAAHALGCLEVCAASAALRALALNGESPLIAGLAAVEALAHLAHTGCDEAHRALESIARDAGRSAVRTEACTTLARLYEPE